MILPAWAIEPPRQADRQGQQAFADYQRAGVHKAFAIAPGGAWAWRGEMPSAEAAVEAALQDCGSHARQRCLAYAKDGMPSFDRQAWEQAWRPYATAREARLARSGMQPGQRFPDLKLTDARGRETSLGEMRGRVVILHFWGSWCPHCVAELPSLQALAERLRGDRRISLVLVPVRESPQRARTWLRARGLRLESHDGGPGVERDQAFTLATGGVLPDRQLARVFPSTYVLDRSGLVLFAHQGAVPGWPEYAPLLRDAAAHSGQ